MILNELLSVIPEYKLIESDFLLKHLEIRDLCIDHRKIEAGQIFIAQAGTKIDAHDFLEQAIEKRPTVIIFDLKKIEKVNVINFEARKTIPLWLGVNNTRETIDKLASQFYKEPSRRLLMIGITGTNGKTSCSYMLECILNGISINTGLIGTIDHHIKSKIWKTNHTTPNPIDLQSRLSEMIQEGAKAVVMEVSSHALDQQRVDSVHFNTVIFTNLTQDHLDYHKTMQKYFEAKQRLFNDILWKSQKVPIFAIVNSDDMYGRKLRVPYHAGVWTYGQNKNADYSFKILKESFSHAEFEIKTPFGEHKSQSPIIGIHNLYNLAASIAAAASMGVPVELSLSLLSKFKGIPGRMQSVSNDMGYHIFVDYAHSPDALEKVLKLLNEIRKKDSSRIITVFGCGGDRDKEKRPLMGKIAEDFSDKVIITTDNPRSEEPLEIISDITSGLRSKNHIIEVDRKNAISKALEIAKKGDVILLAGKGHEQTQIFKNQIVEFNDKTVVEELLRGKT